MKYPSLFEVTLFFVFTIGSLLVAEPIPAQKIIQLTNLTNGRKLILQEGHRVQYQLKNIKKASAPVGVIEAVSDSAITIGGKIIELHQLRSIGRRRKGSGFLIYVLTFFGTSAIIGSVQSDSNDPCPNCIDEGSSGGGYTALGVGMGISMIGLGIHTIVRNSPRDVEEKWKLEIIAAPQPAQ